MTDRCVGPRCGNNPNFKMSDGDRKAVDDFKARLALQASAKPYIERAVWVDFDPLMEVIAATLWEHCARDDEDMPQAVCDDPRTIAAFAAAVARAHAARPTPATDRAAVRADAPVKQRADCTELEWAVQERARFERLYTRETVRADLAEQRADTAARDADIYQKRLDAAREVIASLQEAVKRAPDRAAEFTAADLVAALRGAGAERDRIEAQVVAAGRAAALREAADAVAEVRDTTDVNVAEYQRYDFRQRVALGDAEGRLRRMAREAERAVELRRMADETQQPETDLADRYGDDHSCAEAGCSGEPGDETQQPEAGAAEAPPVCEGFQWIGQSFATCERCGQPAWEHAGEDVAVEGAGPFDNRRTVRPWAPGQADRIRAKWGTPAAVQQPETGA